MDIGIQHIESNMVPQRFHESAFQHHNRIINSQSTTQQYSPLAINSAATNVNGHSDNSNQRDNNGNVRNTKQASQPSVRKTENHISTSKTNTSQRNTKKPDDCTKSVTPRHYLQQYSYTNINYSFTPSTEKVYKYKTSTRSRLTAREFYQIVAMGSAIEQTTVNTTNDADLLFNCGHLRDSSPAELFLLQFGFCDSQATQARQVPSRFLPSLLRFTNRVIECVICRRNMDLSGANTDTIKQRQRLDGEINTKDAMVLKPYGVRLCRCGCYDWTGSACSGSVGERETKNNETRKL